ncbi:MAG: efflux RND transporter periplasmic adaptor subunit [Burkholderiales bacterium]|nr:efflux RND transporter periplasmic adaptor subunit [Burkholderiales bacterium]
MKRWMKWAIPAVAVLVLGAFVGRAIKMKKQDEAAAVGAPAAPVLELAAADVIVLRPLELTRTLAVSGGLKAVNSAVVKAKVAAEIKSLTVREGDSVKAGQVIGQLDTAEYDLRLRQAQQTAASARAQLDIAKRALENNRALVAQGFISATGLETSVSNEAAAQASWQAAAAATELARKSRADSVLVAPISGVVSQRMAQPGERVGVDVRIVEIVDLSRIELEAAVAPEDVGEVQIGHVARLSVDGLTGPATASVVRINPSTQSGTRAVLVYLALQPQPGLRQGLFARGGIDMQRKTALAVPVAAVRIDQARPYVLAVQHGKVALRSVGLGLRGEATLDGRVESVVELTSGAQAGDTILRATAGAVRDGTVVKLPGAAAPGVAPATAPKP